MLDSQEMIAAALLSAPGWARVGCGSLQPHKATTPANGNPRRTGVTLVRTDKANLN